jgi:hypothetical protein
VPIAAATNGGAPACWAVKGTEAVVKGTEAAVKGTQAATKGAEAATKGTVAASETEAAGHISPKITAHDLTGKTRSQIRDFADRIG